MKGTGRPSLHPDHLWQTARDSVAAGVPYNEVAKATGIRRNTIEKRASRDKWHVPGTAINKVRKTLAAPPQAQKAQAATQEGAAAQDTGKAATARAGSLTGPQTTAGALSVGRQNNRILRGETGEKGAKLSDQRDEANAKTAALVLQTLGKNEEKASLMASNIATQLIEQAATSKKHKLARLENVQDLSKALGVVRTANGSDKEEGRVTVNLFAPQGSSGPIDAASRFRRRVIDVEAVPQEV